MTNNLKKNFTWLKYGKLTPDKTAILGTGVKLSYSQLAEKVETLAHRLIYLGIQQGDNVALICPNNKDFIIALLSIWKICAIAVPINFNLLNNEIEKLLTTANAKFTLVHKTFKNKISKDFNPEFFPFPGTIKLKHPHPLPSCKQKDTLILFTSGTTERSKGVLFERKNLRASFVSINSIFNFSANDKMLASLPFFHIGGLSVITRALLSGAAIILPQSLKTRELAKALKKFNPSVISLVPTMLKRLLEIEIEPNSKLRIAFIGGGPAHTELIRSAISKGLPIVKVYGSTETSSMITYLDYKEFQKRPNSVGKPFPGNVIKTIDTAGNVMGTNLNGEIQVTGNSVASGYFMNERDSIDQFANNSFLMSDVGYLDNEGYLFLQNRKDNLIISGGENINPLEVENVISEIPGVKETCVIGLDDNEWGKIVVGVIVKENNSAINGDDVKTFLRKNLPGFKIPKRIYFVDELPKTSLGKIQTRKVYEIISKL